MTSDAGWLWLGVLVFIAISFWWLTQDNRVPIWDAGNHMTLSYIDSQALAHGHLSAPFTNYYLYPPFMHLVGAVSILIVGVHPMALVMTSNLVFTPVLAFSCYGIGKLVAGPRAGLLAGVFALGTPMYVSMMHDFYIDTAQASMVAAALWALLASRRFERVGLSVAAGALFGLAMLTKETSVVFLAGATFAVLLRGGLRRPLGLLGFAIALAVVAAPWYLYHWHDVTASFTDIAQLDVNAAQSPPRWSARNAGWYFWNLVNQQVLLPLTIAFVVGTVIAVRRCIRERFPSESVLPELLTGGLVSYLGMSYLTHKDPRYTLPVLVYVAVLGTFWIPAIRGLRLRRAVTAAVVVVAAVNLVGMSTAIGGTHRLMVTLPGAPQANLVYPSRLTVYENEGWLRGGPQHDADARWLLSGLRRMGITHISFDPSANAGDFSLLGFGLLAVQQHVAMDPAPTQQPNSAYFILRDPQPGDLPPCQRLGVEGGGRGVYVVRGVLNGLEPQLLRNPHSATQKFDFICPGRQPIEWTSASG